ncbi:MAG: hypothetical protein ACKO0N_04800, partial [Planctomycetota bacterium]
KIQFSADLTEIHRDFGRLLKELGDKSRAEVALFQSLSLLRKNIEECVSRVERELVIAKILAGLSEQSTIDKLLAEVKAEVRRLSLAERGQAEQLLVDFYSSVKEFSAAEEIASKIKDPSRRSEAFALIGKRQARLLELKASRISFSKAFEAARKVSGLGTLDSTQLNGGAIRFVARQQAECDLEGVVTYLQGTSDPNLLTYGSLGATEGFDPVKAKIAGEFGRLAKSKLKDVCGSDLACKLVEIDFPLPLDDPWFSHGSTEDQEGNTGKSSFGFHFDH